VPEGAVQASERGFVAYVVENGKARMVPVGIGLRSQVGVEILSGLTPGQTVVVEGSDRLADGVAVQAVTGPPGSPARADATPSASTGAGGSR
jgi:multidrug efflux system membrane fusion protein